tara:strand:- start:436 stop:1269 length:834 start_codon:yes stop_codon:yes gene_type:complete
MKILKELKETKLFLQKIRKKKIKIALIPTMGCIHEGHLSLIRESIKLNYYSLVTIFVNPTQFNNQKDFENYPNQLETDIEILKKNNCNLLYLPFQDELYPNGLIRKKTIFKFRKLLCDNFRPGHFDGVTTVVENFFKILKPDIAFFGEKDFQQLKIIEQIVINNKLPIKIHACSSIRNSNGMSQSSRYKNFTKKQINIFNIISNILKRNIGLLKIEIKLQTINYLKEELLNSGVSKIDYLEIREEKTLNLTNKNKNARLFVAFYIDEIRIIDNFLLY